MPPIYTLGGMVLHGQRSVPSWHGTDNAKMARLAGAWQAVPAASAPTVSPDHMGKR
jgi:hypothetical protein